MAHTEQVLYHSDAIKANWLSKVLFFLITISMVAAGFAIIKRPEEIPVWPFAIPPVILGFILWLVNGSSKAIFAITKTVNGELMCELKTKNNVILQGTPKSMFYWVQITSTMTNESGVTATVEIKTTNGNTFALTSSATDEEFQKIEKRTMSSDHPVYQVGSVGEIIKTLNTAGIPFSFK